jgi:predicted nucleotidyltransferase
VNSNDTHLTFALEKAREIFYDEMNHETTAYLYGSAATGDWTAARSDLDLLVFLKQDQVPLFEEHLRKWKTLKLPFLDGFVCVVDTQDLGTFLFEDLWNGRRNLAEPIVKQIPIPDLWNVRFRSKKLFGSDKRKEVLPRVRREHLKLWATLERDRYWIPEIRRGISKLDFADSDTLVSLTPAIWAASGVMRIMNLVSGGEPISKLKALELFIELMPESESQIQFLIDSFEFDDRERKILTVRQALEISKLCLELLRLR